MYRLPFDKPPAAGNMRSSSGLSEGMPTVYHGSFALDHTGDTFLDMRGWSKGIVFVNGINLGRYWKVGPQQTLYLPGAWLRRGSNDVVVFDLDGGAPPTIAGLRTPILNQLNVASGPTP